MFFRFPGASWFTEGLRVIFLLDQELAFAATLAVVDDDFNIIIFCSLDGLLFVCEAFPSPSNNTTLVLTVFAEEIHVILYRKLYVT